MGKKIKIAIMLITLGIFLMPTRVFSLINLSQQSEYNCCSDSMQQSNSDCCKNHKKQEEGNKDCSGACGSLACHYPTTTTFPLNNLTFSEETNVDAIADFKNLWNYTKQQPKPVYFQIWSPPKLS